MIFQIILTLILANYSFGDDFDQRPKTPEKLLEWMMAEPGPNARKVSKNRDENFVGTSKERMRWFRQLGLPLKPKDIEAIKKLSRTPSANTQENTKISAPLRWPRPHAPIHSALPYLNAVARFSVNSRHSPII